MDANELIGLLTKEDVIDICEDLGSTFHKVQNSNVIVFDSFCHGSDSHKLWYYHDSRRFTCF